MLLNLGLATCTCYYFWWGGIVEGGLATFGGLVTPMGLYYILAFNSSHNFLMLFWGNTTFGGFLLSQVL